MWQSSHETADRRLAEILTSEAPEAIHWLEEHGVEFTHENGGYRLARCGGASRKRLLQVGDRTGLAITTALRDAFLDSSGDVSRAKRAVGGQKRKKKAKPAKAAKKATKKGGKKPAKKGKKKGKR